jgi:hypothetical protein
LFSCKTLFNLLNANPTSEFVTANERLEVVVCAGMVDMGVEVDHSCWLLTGSVDRLDVLPAIRYAVSRGV